MQVTNVDSGRKFVWPFQIAWKSGRFMPESMSHLLRNQWTICSGFYGRYGLDNAAVCSIITIVYFLQFSTPWNPSFITPPSGSMKNWCVHFFLLHSKYHSVEKVPVNFLCRWFQPYSIVSRIGDWSWGKRIMDLHNADSRRKENYSMLSRGLWTAFGPFLRTWV